VRKEPTQQRARATVEALLQASAELFAELGFAETTTNKIAERAGVSVGSLYQYFPDKEAILTTLFEQHVRAGLPRIDAALEHLADPGRPLREGLGALVQEVVAAHELSPRLHQVLFDEVPRSAIMMRMQAEADRRGHEAVTRLLGRLPGVRQDSLEVMAHLLVQTTEALAHWMVLRAPRTLSRKRCIAETVELLHRYVTGTSQRSAQ
jgi:AcrR family transcriptional regulator